VIDHAPPAPRTARVQSTQRTAGHVVLLDASGRPTGTADKRTVHGADTPLHLAFSCYVVDETGRTLLTRRSSRKRTWPGIWTNACCGHPQAGETLRQAVSRHLQAELGLRPVRIAVALGDFAYRAAMHDGTVEHELCPVVVAETAGILRPDPDEVDDWTWVDWPDLVTRVAEVPLTLSPWSVAQVSRMVREGFSPTDLFDRSTTFPALDRVHGVRHAFRRDPADLLATSQVRVDLHLSEFLNDRRRDVPEAADAIDVLSAEIDSLTAAGGKRLRPAFVLGGHLAAGGDPDDMAAVDAAAAVELLHTFALMHDDVMDRSHVRRGRPTAHRSLRSHHGGPAADADWFGISAAVLAGDLAFVWADAMLDRLDNQAVAEDRRRRTRELFTLLRTEVIAGQLLDLQIGCSAFADEHDAMRIALLKSARYTVTRPLQIGAALAGASPDLERELGAYGDAVGVAFQLRDDVLGMFGNPLATGKPTCDDLREGKHTLLVTRALALAAHPGRELLSGALGRADLDDTTAERCRDVIASSCALASVVSSIDTAVDGALDALHRLDASVCEPLTDLALYAAYRDR
jgi:isopentenyl-diphosphate delta-isomerase type 1